MTEQPTLQDFMPNGNMTDNRTNLIGMTMDDIKNLIVELDEKPFRAKQLHNWIYARGAKCIDEMTDLSKAFRERLNKSYTVNRPIVTQHQVSSDGTQKWLLKYPDGNEAETVFIPDKERGTLCVSSQVGCTLTCKFCHTGTQKLVRNLTPADIVGQVMLARDTLGDWLRGTEKRLLTNIVFMGMGEPLYNTNNVIKALNLLNDPDGIAISRRKVTVSTSGVASDILRIGQETGAMLAISLHAPNDETRTEIMPINKKFNLASLIDVCRVYPEVSKTHRITWEYVMLKGINDSDQDAYDLVKLIESIPSKINIIPFNPWEGSIYECSSKDRIKKFSDILAKNGIPCPIRKTRGEDIMAACGQLKSASEKIPNWKLREMRGEGTAT